MIDQKDLRDVAPKAANGAYSAAHVDAGVPISKIARLYLLSDSEWESFVEEWSSSLKSRYVAVKRFSGAGDKGIDIAAFKQSQHFKDGWDNYQCKHYGHALRPSDVWIEIGKVVYFSFAKEFPPPDKYFFVATKGIGTTLSKLLSDPDKLKNEFLKHWNSHCRDKLTQTGAIKLTGALKTYTYRFDFGIFDSISPVTLVEQHANTPFHSVRFGGGLPIRATPSAPPAHIQPNESLYIQQLYDVYSEVENKIINSTCLLATTPTLEQDFLRQRERFYCAEALRNFARDNVPEGAFDALKEETLYGVIDTCEASHINGLTRMRETLNTSVILPFNSNPLFTVIGIRDKQGMCHQLANENRLRWIKQP